MTWVKVGAKCICIKTGSFSLINPGPGTWTIKHIFDHGGDLHAVFEERPTGGELVERFRPLITKTIEDDIAVFKRIADQVPNMEENTNEQVG